MSNCPTGFASRKTRSPFPLRIKSMEAEYGKENKNTIEEYLNYFIEKELGFYTEEPDAFPAMSDEWKSPHKITNSIIDSKKHSNHDYENIFNQLQELGCQAIQLRFFDQISISEIEAIISFTNDKIFKSIELCVNDCLGLSNEKEINDFINKNQIVSHLHLFCKDEDKAYRNEFGVYITSSKEEMKLDNCGVISPDYFTPSLYFYTEALKYNTCLNRKISIDWNGEIKNCPSMEKSFGNIKTVKLNDIVGTEEFVKLWHIKKDDIEECKVCEFRYVCSDCRAYLKDPLNVISKPAKCKYNTKTAEWE